MKNRINSLFGIDFPIIQAGMVWCSGWKLASSVSNAGGLGIIGSGSMHPEVLEEHIIKCKNATKKPFAVNVPMFYPEIETHISLIIQHAVPIVFMSAGNPKTWTKHLQKHGITVVHVVSSLKFAKKAEDSGVDAVVAEGFEAGGHNGRDETTTLCLIPLVVEKLTIPVIAAGGIGTGRGMLAVMNLGAEGVQIGSRFVASNESSAHQNFKNCVVNVNEGETQLTYKEISPVRLIKTNFFEKLSKAYENNASTEELKQLYGHGRGKKGMFEGDLMEGELEIGQVSGMIKEIIPAKDIIDEILKEYHLALAEQQSEKFIF